MNGSASAAAIRVAPIPEGGGGRLEQQLGPPARSPQDLKAWRTARVRALKRTAEFKSLSKRSNARRLIGHMVMKYDALDGSGMFPAQKKLARELGLKDRKTITRCLSELVAAGVLVSEKRTRGSGGWKTSNVYRLACVPTYGEVSQPSGTDLTVPSKCPNVVSQHEGLTDHVEGVLKEPHVEVPSKVRLKDQDLITTKERSGAVAPVDVYLKADYVRSSDSCSVTTQEERQLLVFELLARFRRDYGRDYDHSTDDFTLDELRNMPRLPLLGSGRS